MTLMWLFLELLSEILDCVFHNSSFHNFKKKNTYLSDLLLMENQILSLSS